MGRTVALALILVLPAFRGQAHPGALDGNGCHYENSTGRYHCHRRVKPNPDVNAAVKQPRENVCHDESSPNYRTVRYFIAYQTMPGCLASGGRAPR